MIDLFAGAKLSILFLPHLEQVFDLGWLEFSQRQRVVWAVANYACDSRRRLVAINARRRLQRLRRLKANARMIVVKNKRAGVVVVSSAVDAQVAGAEIAIRNVLRATVLRCGQSSRRSRAGSACERP